MWDTDGNFVEFSSTRLLSSFHAGIPSAPYLHGNFVAGAVEHIPTYRLVPFGTIWYNFSMIGHFLLFFEIKRLFACTKFENVKMSAPSSNTFSRH